MKYYIDVIKTKKNNAAKKAPADIAQICCDMGLKALKMPSIPYDRSMTYQKFWMLTVWAWALLRIGWRLKEKDILLIQHPLYGTKLLTRFIPWIKKKGVGMIALIHDLNIVRVAAEEGNTHNKSVELQDYTILKLFDFIICHNSKMLEYLASHGMERNKLISLGIFDYLCEKPHDNQKKDQNGLNTVVIAGNLLPEKSGYIYELCNSINENSIYKLFLYGNGFCNDLTHKNEKVEYKGSVSPELLPEELKYDFGIVWDGNTISTCAGHTGNYLRYNNPHKTSLYLAAEIPVIVWDKAAIAEFVQQNAVGVTVSSLEDIKDLFSNLSDADYEMMKNNTRKIAEKIRKGYYFRKAYEEAVKQYELGSE